jgi:pyridoxal phosphate enzyme (YggS family)
MAYRIRARACYSFAFWALTARRTILSFQATRSVYARHILWSQYYSTFHHQSYRPTSPWHKLYQEFATTKLTMSEQTTEVNVGGNLQYVAGRIVDACKTAGRDPNDIRLVAVSKTKPLELLKQAYENGQRVFGENYAQELVEKAKDIGESDVVWHFIGGLQSNKVNMLVKNVLPYGKLVVETVGSAKVADKLDSAMRDFDGKLDIFVQVNTSEEESKSGVSPVEAVDLCRHITSSCGRLQLKGVMTIGASGDVQCLETLVHCRQMVADNLGIKSTDLELSMGMSDDFEIAIFHGSTNVRVGSTIFGSRDYSKGNP